MRTNTPIRSNICTVMLLGNPPGNLYRCDTNNNLPSTVAVDSFFKPPKMSSDIQYPTPAFGATPHSSHHGSTGSIELSRFDGPSSYSDPIPAATPNVQQNYDDQAEAAEPSTLRNESSLAPVDGGYRAWSFVCCSFLRFSLGLNQHKSGAT